MAAKKAKKGNQRKTSGGGRRGGKKAPARASRKPTPREGGEGSFLARWLQASPSLAVGLFATLPVWIGYEIAQWHYGRSLPENGAEAVITWLFGQFRYGHHVLRFLAGALIIGAGVLIVRRRVPLLRVGGLVFLEGLAWGTILGPLGLLVSRNLYLGPEPFWPTGFFVSMGAGFYEELLFRLFLLSLVQVFIGRAFAFHGAPSRSGLAAAALLTGFLFALAHHVDPAARPVQRWPLIFRTVLGTMLGVLFVFRGFGVVVYAHTWYDMIIFYAQQQE